MKTQHPNFTRQVLQQFSKNEFKSNSGLFEAIRPYLLKAEKFYLPISGRLFDDNDFKALDESEILNLPFPSIVLEYFTEGGKPPFDEGSSSKRMVLVVECSDRFVCTMFWYSDLKQEWIETLPFVLPRTNYLDPSDRSHLKILATTECDTTGYGDAAGSLLSMLNALQCSNVKIEKSKTKKVTVKSALQFDSYNILTIESRNSSKKPSSGGGSHRSPREHLRRGHIRRLETGRKIWVNAAVIGAGKGAGKITKDYRVN